MEPVDNINEDRQAGQDWARRMADNQLAPGTKTSYMGKLMGLLGFVVEHYPDVLHKKFIRAYNEAAEDGNAPERPFFDNALANAATAPIIKIAKLAEQPEAITAWLATFKSRGGDETASKSVYGVAQSALKFLLTRQNVAMPLSVANAIKAVVKGVKRTIAQKKQNGELPMEEGKDAIPSDILVMLLEELAKSTDKNAVFIRAFFLTSLAMVTRANNTTQIRLSHINWMEDALTIYLAKHKADQSGERTSGKSCYANPTQPHLCLILALAIYFALDGERLDALDKKVFDGESQDTRYTKGLQAFITSNDRVREALEARGTKPEGISSHSLRKSARSFLESGTTCAPAAATIHRRGNWSAPGERDVGSRREGDRCCCTH